MFRSLVSTAPPVKVAFNALKIHHEPPGNSYLVSNKKSIAQTAATKRQEKQDSRPKLRQTRKFGLEREREIFVGGRLPEIVLGISNVRHGLMHLPRHEESLGD